MATQQLSSMQETLSTLLRRSEPPQRATISPHYPQLPAVTPTFPSHIQTNMEEEMTNIMAMIRRDWVNSAPVRGKVKSMDMDTAIATSKDPSTSSRYVVVVPRRFDVDSLSGRRYRLLRPTP